MHKTYAGEEDELRTICIVLMRRYQVVCMGVGEVEPRASTLGFISSGENHGPKRPYPVPKESTLNVVLL